MSPLPETIHWKTDNRLQKRISVHRTHVRSISLNGNAVVELSDDLNTLAQHLKEVHNLDSVEAFNLSYTFTILQINPRNLDRCEQKWANQLVTLHPYGLLNIEKPCGVADTILNMSRKATPSSQRR